MAVRAGRLLVVEGPEGAGKSTQVRRLATRLREIGVPCALHREPGGTPLGDRIREILLEPGGRLTPRAETALFLASRAELVATTVRPALQNGTIVILDRFFLSTYAYQVHGRGLPEDEVRDANAFATAGLIPDLTIVLRLPFAEGLRRADTRGARDRMESSGEEFHHRVEGAFELFATTAWQNEHPEAGPIAAVDAAGSEDDVAARIDALLGRRWPDIFPVSRTLSS